ncbi:MAG: hypothetical protein ACC656_10085 [Candidatus Heimdallarchaeota archaeon]
MVWCNIANCCDPSLLKLTEQKIFYISHPFDTVAGDHPFHVRDVTTGQAADGKLSTKDFTTWIVGRY